MECMSCGAQWTVREGQTRLANCPFCGKPLLMERSTAIYTDFMEAMRAVVQMKGAGFLLNEPSKVLGIFLDITKGLQREYQLLKLFYGNETQKFFKDAQGLSEGQLCRASRSLQENMFMNPDSAKYIVDAFAILLGKKEAERLPGIMNRNLRGEPESLSRSNVAEEKLLPPPREEIIFGDELEVGEFIQPQSAYRVYRIKDITYGEKTDASVLIKVRLLDCVENKITEEIFQPVDRFIYYNGIYIYYHSANRLPEWWVNRRDITKNRGKIEWVHRNGLYLLSGSNNSKAPTECSEEVVDLLTDRKRMQYLYKKNGIV